MLWPFVLSKIRKFEATPVVPGRQDAAISFPGPSVSPAGSQFPSGYAFDTTGAPETTVEAGITLISPSGFAVVPSLLT